jgi:hypothetical protein
VKKVDGAFPEQRVADHATASPVSKGSQPLSRVRCKQMQQLISNEKEATTARGFQVGQSRKIF